MKYFTNKSKKHYEARKEARDYYQTLYGHIAYVEQMMSAYIGAVKECMTSDVTSSEALEKIESKVFIKDKGFVSLPFSEVRTQVKDAYDNLLSYYNQKRCEGFEIYNSVYLNENLIRFFYNASSVKFIKDFQGPQDYDSKNFESIMLAKEFSEHIREHMQELFGLK
jgi:hypothetical protein